MSDSSISILNRTLSSLDYDNSAFEKFTFQSVITKLEKPIGKGCPVHVMNKITGQVVYKTETDETSSIYIPNLRKYNKYIIIAFDLTDVYNSIVFDINWDFNSDAGYNYSLAYYDMSDLDNIQSIFDFKYPTPVTDPNLVLSISIPFANDGSQVSWGASAAGTIRRENIGTIPAYNFNGSGFIMVNRGVFYNSLPFTYEAYFNTYSTNGSLNQCLMNQHNTALNKYVALYLDPNLNLVFERQEVIVGVPAVRMQSTAALKLDTNYHVALCYDGTTFYLFLNGVLQTTISDSIGYPYYDYGFYIGQQFLGNIGGIAITETCKYTSNFNVLFEPISYNRLVYSDPSDTFAQYVAVLIKNNKLTPQVMIDDKAKNTRFQANLSESSKDYFTIQNTFSPTVAGYSNIPLSTKDFCIEMCFKLLNKVTYPTIVSNQSTTGDWTTGSWGVTASHSSYPNKYSFLTYATPFHANYPSIFKEQIDLAVVRQGTALRFYVNGFLDQTYTIAANVDIDPKAASYLAIGRDINYNLYDLKLTVGHCRYTADYTPKLIDITNKDILEMQYQYVNLPFKKALTDGMSPLTLSYKDVQLSPVQSINGTNSAIFNGTTSSYLLDNWYTSKEKFCAEMFVYPILNANTTQTLFSLYDATSEKFKVGIVNGKLSFHNGTSWTDTSYTMDYNKFNHIVVKREGTVLKILAEGNLVYTATVVTALGNPLKVSIGASKYTLEFFQGYINNLYIYKNYIKYTDSYTVPVEDIVVDPNIDPVVIVDQYTTSALDFEQGLSDKVSNTSWTNGGLGEINTNKIFGTYSYETKDLASNLTSSSPLITGGATPYTIEFYALINNFYGPSTSQYPLYSKSNNSSVGDQYFGVDPTNGNKIFYARDANAGGRINSVFSNPGKLNLRLNEVYKYTVSYDGSALRFFINDVLDLTLGTANGYQANTSMPFTLMGQYIPSYSQYRSTTKGIIDNVNIFDNVAKTVRNKDEYVDYLSVDLAFDGVNNSTKIVDNGKEKLTWTVASNAVLSTNRFLTGCSSLYSTNGRLTSSTTVPLGTADFTVDLEIYNTGSSDIWCRYFMLGNNSTDGSFFIANNNNTESIIVDLYGGGGYLRLFTSAASTVPFNKWNRITVIRESGIFYLYINNVLQGSNSNYISSSIIGDTIRLMANNSGTERVNGNINSCRVYKNIAIRPENISNRIQLDFDNNFNDNYNNSTWTLNSIAYDQVNAISGYAAVFDAVTDYAETSSVALNYGTNDFKISFDLKETDKAASREVASNNISSASSGSMWIPSSAVSVGFDYADKPSSSVGLGSTTFINNYYHHTAVRKSSSLFKKTNGVLIGMHNIPATQSFNFVNGGTFRLGKPTTTFNSGVNGIIGYLDNFKSIGNYTGTDVIDRPAVLFPMQTNLIDLGYASNQNVNNYGPVTFTNVGGKKCAQFGSGKYLNLPSNNNLFNFGTTSDFYIEFEFYRNSVLAANNVSYLLSDGYTSTNYTSLSLSATNRIGIRIDPDTASIDYECALQTWYKVVFKRTNGTATLSLYSTTGNLLGSIAVNMSNINFARGVPTIGGGTHFNNIALDGYMANFKMFVGIGDLPINYNDRKILNLDFKPTYKSYLFKDNYNNNVLHPNNIVSRDYINGQYCCSFNGTNQFIQLGKNDLLNFGLDDFVIRIKFRINSFTNTWQRLLSDNQYSSGAMNYIMITGSDYSIVENRNKIFFGLSDSGSQYMFSTSTIVLNTDYEVTFIRSGNTISMYLNDILENSFTTTYVCNFNMNSNTFIGAATQTEGTVDSRAKQYFNGSIYSVKVLRNTTDVNLFKDNVVVTPTPPVIDVGNRIYSVKYNFDNSLVDSVSSTSLTMGTGTATYGAKITTDVPSTASFDFGGSRDIIIPSTVGSQFTLDGDFTLGFDIKVRSIPSQKYILSSQTSSVYSVTIALTTVSTDSNLFKVYVYDSRSSSESYYVEFQHPLLKLNTDVNFKIIRYGNTLRAYVNNYFIKEVPWSTTIDFNKYSKPIFGNYTTGNSYTPDALLDTFFICKNFVETTHTVQYTN